MTILNFYYVMSFYLLKSLPKNLEKSYSFFFNLVIIVMKKPKEAAYSRYYLYDSFKAIDKELFKFFKTHEHELTPEQKELINNLINLNQNLKRFFRFTETYQYPSLIEKLTLEELQKYTEETTKIRRSLRGPYDVTFLANKSYFELAKKIQKEADDWS